MKITPEERNQIESSTMSEGANRDKKEMISFGGIARSETGQLTRSNYFRFLNHNLDDYTDIEFTPEEAKRVHTHLLKLSTGASAMAPMYCGGDICPFKERCVFWQMGKAPVGKQCHKGGDLIWTTDGYIKIEELDPEIHTLVGYEEKRNAIRRGMEEDRKGFAFVKTSRPYSGLMHRISVGNKEANITSNHICIARWNEKALNKFCVYLMKKGSFWRVGKSRILGFHSEKYHLPFAHRAYKEKADSLWILGVYNTNTEALLAEEYFSIEFQSSKACFIESFEKLQKEQIKDNKYNGLYRWATTKQLEDHHARFVKPYCFYAEKLANLGLDIEFPIWESNNTFKNKGDVKLYARNTMLIRACNLIPDIMDLPIQPEELFVTNHGTKSYLEASWATFEKIDSIFTGTVYSLEVETHNTYFVNGIAIHNCLVEVELMKRWITDYMEEFDVDPNNATEVAYVNELAELQILEMRVNMNLAKASNAELVTEQTIGVDRDGDPILQQHISPFMELKEKLSNRRSKIIKLMVGDRQEKYKKEAALKLKLEDDPSSKMAAMRTKLEGLSRQLTNMEKQNQSTEPAMTLSPEDLIAAE